MSEEEENDVNVKFIWSDGQMDNYTTRGLANALLPFKYKWKSLTCIFLENLWRLMFLRFISPAVLRIKARLKIGLFSKIQAALLKRVKIRVIWSK